MRRLVTLAAVLAVVSADARADGRRRLLGQRPPVYSTTPPAGQPVRAYSPTPTIPHSPDRGFGRPYYSDYYRDRGWAKPTYPWPDTLFGGLIGSGNGGVAGLGGFPVGVTGLGGF